MAEQTEKGSDAYVAYAAVGVGTWVAYQMLFSGGSTNPDGWVHRMCEDDEFADFPEGGKYAVTKPWEKRPIRLAKKGIGARAPVTVFEMIEKAVAANPEAIHYRWEECVDEKSGEHEWHDISRGDMLTLIHRVSRALVKCGLKPWQATSIIGFNSLPWFAAALGTMFAGGIVAGQYTTNNAGQCKYIANHSKSAVAFCEDSKQAKKWLEIAEEVDELSTVVVWGVLDDDVRAGFKETKVDVLTWDEFLALGDADDKDELATECKNRRSEITPEQCCTLIYTSGTTGPPKAVMMSHDNVIFDASIIMDTNRHIDYRTDHALVSYLPLSHIAAQLADCFLPYALMAFEGGNCEVTIARPSALKGTLVDSLKAARPTIFFGVPRVWEKIEEKMRAVGKANTGIKKAIGDWAKRIGLEGFQAAQIGGSGVLPDFYNVADKVVFGNIRKALGFDRLVLAISGAAPIKKSTVDYFGSIGFRLVEVYGMSENGGAHTLGKPYYFKSGTVGVTLNSAETMIDHADGRDKEGEGEICMRGRHVMMGYMYDEDKTAQAIDQFGFLHSGDVGQVDEHGILHITGRIKELIITAGGENIAPVPIEDYIKTRLSGVSNFVLIGDKRKYLTALVSLKLEQDLETQEFGEKLVGDSADVSEDSTTLAEAQKDPKWKAYIQSTIDAYNADPEACVSRAQRIQYFTILDGDFGVLTGELTSTMKMKRSVVNEMYADVIDAMYGE